MHRTFDDARRWADDGTSLLLGVMDNLTGKDMKAPSTLPDWTRKHLIAHINANAHALVNLVQWAATGVPTPMYRNARDRAAGIERGVRLSSSELSSETHASAAQLATASALLTSKQWDHPIKTAQGRTVTAREIPWMRAREVFVHVVDLDSGVTFDHLPEEFLLALEADVIGKRGDVPSTSGSLPDRVAWLTGRPHALKDAPPLGPWL